MTSDDDLPPFDPFFGPDPLEIPPPWTRESLGAAVLRWNRSYGRRPWLVFAGSDGERSLLRFARDSGVGDGLRLRIAAYVAGGPRPHDLPGSYEVAVGLRLVHDPDRTGVTLQ